MGQLIDKTVLRKELSELQSEMGFVRKSDVMQVLCNQKCVSDYIQWKNWLDQWHVKYEEKTWNPNIKELIIGGTYCQASIVFDLDDKFIEMTAYENNKKLTRILSFIGKEKYE
jgi:hypothetical protein